MPGTDQLTDMIEVINHMFDRDRILLSHHGTPVHQADNAAGCGQRL